MGGLQNAYPLTAVTHVVGDRTVWEDHAPFRAMLAGNPIEVLTVKDMIEDLMPTIGTTPASSEIGRLLQVIKAAGGRIELGRRSRIRSDPQS